MVLPHERFSITNPPAADFSQVTKGTCEDHGLKEINSPILCEMGAKQQGWSWTNFYWNKLGTQEPPGLIQDPVPSCSMRMKGGAAASNILLFNYVLRDDASQACSASRTCLCFRLSKKMGADVNAVQDRQEVRSKRPVYKGAGGNFLYYTSSGKWVVSHHLLQQPYIIEATSDALAPNIVASQWRQGHVPVRLDMSPCPTHAPSMTTAPTASPTKFITPHPTPVQTMYPRLELPPTPLPNDDDDAADPLALHTHKGVASKTKKLARIKPAVSPTKQATSSPTPAHAHVHASPTLDKPIAIVRFHVVYKTATSTDFIAKWRESFAAVVGVSAQDVHTWNEKREQKRCSFDQTIFISQSFCKQRGEDFCNLADWKNPMIQEIQNADFKAKVARALQGRGVTISSKALGIAAPYTTKVAAAAAAAAAAPAHHRAAQHASLTQGSANRNNEAQYIQKEVSVLGPLVTALVCLSALVGATALRASASASSAEEEKETAGGGSTSAYVYDHGSTEEKISLVESIEAEEDI
jgi:hypothetical protein